MKSAHWASSKAGRRSVDPTGQVQHSHEGHCSVFSAAAVAHGKLRYSQSYTPEMLVHESRIFQVTIFGTLQNNMNALDFSLLLPDVMAIADEVDAQLTQTMGSYMNLLRTAVA